MLESHLVIGITRRKTKRNEIRRTTLLTQRQRDMLIEAVLILQINSEQESATRMIKSQDRRSRTRLKNTRVRTLNAEKEREKSVLKQSD